MHLWLLQLAARAWCPLCLTLPLLLLLLLLLLLVQGARRVG
jgi:hypothetical protein